MSNAASLHWTHGAQHSTTWVVINHCSTHQTKNTRTKITMTATQSLVKSATTCLGVPLLQMESARNQSDFSLMCLYPFKSSCSSSTHLRCALYPCRAIILPAPVRRSPKASLLYLTPQVFWPFDKRHPATERAGGAAIGTIASLLLGGRLTQESQFIAHLKRKKPGNSSVRQSRPHDTAQERLCCH